MDSAQANSFENHQQTAQLKVEAHLARASQLRGENESQAVLEELEAAYARAKDAPYEIEFQTRIRLAIELAEAYLNGGETEKARRLLDSESAFAEQIFNLVQASGTTAQKRTASAGRVQIRDRARQASILGTEAPEISVKHWVRGAATTLSSLRGQVVMLEFWATWCKPCQEMFPKLKRLDEANRARGLEIIAFTRHYLARRGSAESEAEELALMRGAIEPHGLEFRVGVAEDERLQELYGATGLPTLVLIDRGGIVRYAHLGGGPDEDFQRLLEECLQERI